MPLHESGEMYLETIYLLSTQKSSVRSIDVCEHIGYSKPSVSRAVGLLKKGGFITVASDGIITLTEEGKARAEKIFERHTVISSVLEMLGVDKEIAVRDACRIEHVISDETFDVLKKHLKQE